MTLQTLWLALALVLVFEGILPFSSPAKWRQMMERMLTLTDQQLRVAGMVGMVIGVVLILFIKN